MVMPPIEQNANPTLRIMSVEARAQLVSDAMGRITEGDCRKRVFEAAKQQIENAVAVALSFERANPGAFKGQT